MNTLRTTRRHILVGLLAAPASVSTSQAFAAHDELAELIAEYRRQFTRYDEATGAMSDEEDEAFAEATYMPLWRRLRDEPPAATTRRGALDALRLAHQEMRSMTGGLEMALVGAALAYLEEAA